jgi:Tol biopolymer transport system component
MHTLTRLVLAAVAIGVLTGSQSQDRPEVQLKAAVYKETVEGDHQGAIALYKQIVSNAAVPRPIAAAALLGLGGCYEKVGEAQARGAYERLIADYPEQAREVAAARARLAALKATSPEASSLPTLRLLWSGTDVDTSGEISPDGRLLAYTNWDTGDLAVRNVRSGQTHMVTSKGGKWETDDFALSPRWSPDGKRLAYYWYRDDGDLNELRVADLSGKNVHVLHSQRELKGALAPIGWYPDGTALFATLLDQQYATEVVRVSMEDGTISPVGKLGSVGAKRVCLSPDGRYIAFDGPADSDSLNMDVFMMPSSGGRAVPVVTGPYDDQLLAWTPDGRRVFFASNRSGANDAWLMQVDSGNPVGSPLLLRKELGLVEPIGFSPNGAFYFGPDLAVHDVLVADWSPESQKAASAPRLATEHFSGSTRLPAWSPDGRKLAYLVHRGSRRPAETRVRIRDMETGAERTLADVKGSVYDLSWSPDGTSLAMTVKSARSPSVCQIVEVDSGKIVREITATQNGEDIWRFLWPPGGSIVYYVTAGASRNALLLRRDLRTGDETPVYTGTPGVPLDFAVSPDGEHVAVVQGRRIMLIAATGGEPRQLVAETPGFQASQTLAWSPDGRYVYFGRRLPGAVRLYRVAVTGGAPEDLNLEIGGEFRFRPDGRRLAFTRSKGEPSGEIWVMENFLPVAKGTPADAAQTIKK